jgi:hypothetical protein
LESAYGCYRQRTHNNTWLRKPSPGNKIAETKHKWNLGIKTLSMETRVVRDINIWKLNLKTKQQAY